MANPDPDQPKTAITLPPAPPVPELPLGLPPLAATESANAVAFGELLFTSNQLSANNDRSCASCHRSEKSFTDDTISTAYDGKRNARFTPPLINLAWRKDFGWDGRYVGFDALLAAHIKGQLGNDLATAATRLSQSAELRAHAARTYSRNPEDELAGKDITDALRAYVVTRFRGDTAWDKFEKTGSGEASSLKAGYDLFVGVAGCGTCHVPPLYTDNGFHRIGLIRSPDEGRGRVDPQQPGAFRTPSLRGLTGRSTFFHDGSAGSLAAAIDWHLAGGTGHGADSSIIDPALKVVALSDAEKLQLTAFVETLSALPSSKPSP